MAVVKCFATKVSLKRFSSRSRFYITVVRKY